MAAKLQNQLNAKSAPYYLRFEMRCLEYTWIISRKKPVEAVWRALSFTKKVY